MTKSYEALRGSSSSARGAEGYARKRSRVKFDFNFFRSISARSLSVNAENLPFVNIFLSVQLFIARLFLFAVKGVFCAAPRQVFLFAEGNYFSINNPRLEGTSSYPRRHREGSRRESRDLQVAF